MTRGVCCRAIEMNCTNAMFPDLYGNYRNATATQVKHHWWWKINTVFDRLTAIRYYTGILNLTRLRFACLYSQSVFTD
jgi:hypothetical protein